MKYSEELYFDHLIIGSGLAGLSSALTLAEKCSGQIAIVTKGAIDDCNSRLAQGGIACVTDDKDSFEEHLEDTLYAGGNLCNRDNAMKIIQEGPGRIRWLVDTIGTHFTTRGEMGDQKDAHKNEYDLGREGGHHKRRILHAGDITGEEVERSLIEACRKEKRIHVFENHI
ncbi:MAG: FAD-binding protein, partial [Lentisphaeria bacterium]|nr:FAD-binding protein [Lentisphaeria bacterium]